MSEPTPAEAPAIVTPSYKLEPLDSMIREHVRLALELYAWNMTRTAEALGVDRRTLYRMVERHKVERPAELAKETRAECIGCGKLAPETDPPVEPGFVWACSPACSRKGSGPST